jgi:hypothetical protein
MVSLPVWTGAGGELPMARRIHMPAGAQAGHQPILRSAAAFAGERGGFAPWCGPAAIAHVTGRSYAGACALLHGVAPDRYPEGAELVTAWWRDLVAALAADAVPLRPMPELPEPRPTLCAYARGLGMGWYLLRVTGHFLLLHVRAPGLPPLVFDNRHDGEVPGTARAHGRRRVTHALLLPEGPRLLAGA